MPLRHLVPRPLRTRLRGVSRARRMSPIAADRESRDNLVHLHDRDYDWGGRDTVGVRLAALGGAEIELRPGSTDAWVVAELFDDFAHREPEDLGPLTVIWDLGAFVGATMADFACRHPEATVIGVELDPANAELTRRNVRFLGDRAKVLRGAVWHSDGEISFTPNPVDLVAGHIEEGGDAQAPAISLNTLLAEHTPGGHVDFVKMDIEGAEAQVLKRNTEWARHAGAILVEVHPPYTVEECFADLEALGFATRVHFLPEVGMPAIFGHRPAG
jgi:FkbM family methyltransferase